MAKTVEAVINGTAYQMPASYKASKEIAEKVGDPLKLALSAHQNNGAVPMSVDDVVTIIAIGVKHAGCSLPKDEIGEHIVSAGLMTFLPIVGSYMLAICTGSAGEVKDSAKKGGRKSAG
jgi:hypothetical protein